MELAASPLDTDKDGLPDTIGGWNERSTDQAGDPRNALLDYDGDGYTILEKYLNHLMP